MPGGPTIDGDDDMENLKKDLDDAKVDPFLAGIEGEERRGNRGGAAVAAPAEGEEGGEEAAAPQIGRAHV